MRQHILAFLIDLVARGYTRQRKTIQIAGIEAMVYALLTATPMHNLMVNIALAFFLAAISAIVIMLFHKRQFGLANGGIGCIVLKLCFPCAT